ncbi:complement resistance protein TraT [Candidatus Spongiihabitans sp.]|uniref:complement resistance protein TraT n=1 Tax=Candidatus Spongiihabitans sp. TaxID=3101308 RepID=UPI003C7B9A01
MQLLKSASLALTAFGLVIIAGCASAPPEWSAAAKSQQTQTGVQIRPSDLGVPKTASVEYIRVKTEKSIFLDPPEENNEVYLRVGDTSGRAWAGISMRDLVAQELGKRGFTVVNNAKTASYALQVNILLADEISAAEIAQLDETQYGQDLSGIVKSVVIGTVVGGVAGSVLGNTDNTLAGAVGGGILGGVLKGLSGSRKQDLLLAQQATKYFSIIMDVEVRERAKGTVTRSGETNIITSQNSSTSDNVADTSVSGSQSIGSTETESFTEQSTWKRHRSRVVGKAKGKLVVFEDVEQDFAMKMIRAIAGFF